MIESGSDLAKSNENLNVFYKVMFQLLENCTKSENHTTSIAREFTAKRQK